MNLSEINWDFNTAGNWPPVVKTSIFGLIIITVIAIGFYYDTSDELSSLDHEKQKEQTLKKNSRINKKRPLIFRIFKNN